ncbi:hypothetical protein [Alicyclobacillus shizuokensis]|uniref:hypothetical protein n=1 Tax=Alicyclobacillus shizuokensis TaxID=392014 RepID=UPI0012ED5429|nr:hypothetical protein [Alicyclobacillus shizuokensis]
MNDIQFQPDVDIDDMVNQFHATNGTDNQDVGFVHRMTGAGILARSSGTLEGFADYGLGFRIDPDTQSITFVAPTIQFLCYQTKTYDPNFKQPLNPINKEFADVLQILGGTPDGTSV